MTRGHADRLREAGVPVRHEHFDDMLHAFVSFPQIDTAADGLAAIGEGLRNAFDLE